MYLGPTHRPLKPVLVPMAVVMDQLKLRREAVMELVDCGELRWVWDTSRGAARKVEYRFWQPELDYRVDGTPLPGSGTGVPPVSSAAHGRDARATTAAGVSLPEVIELVIGRAQVVPHLHSESVKDILWTTRTVVHNWLKVKELEGHTIARRQFVTRASLAAFLQRRIVS